MTEPSQAVVPLDRRADDPVPQHDPTHLKGERRRGTPVDVPAGDRLDR